MVSRAGDATPLQQGGAEALPKTPMLPGAVCGQWVRCGKPGCKCARGELHGPYFYRFVRQGGRLRKRYARLADLDAVREACEAWRRAEEAKRALLASPDGLAVKKQIAEMLRSALGDQWAAYHARRR